MDRFSWWTCFELENFSVVGKWWSTVVHIRDVREPLPWGQRRMGRRIKLKGGDILSLLHFLLWFFFWRLKDRAEWRWFDPLLCYHGLCFCHDRWAIICSIQYLLNCTNNLHSNVVLLYFFFHLICPRQIAYFNADRRSTLTGKCSSSGFWHKISMSLNLPK